MYLLLTRLLLTCSITRTVLKANDWSKSGCYDCTCIKVVLARTFSNRSPGKTTVTVVFSKLFYTRVFSKSIPVFI